MVVEVGVIEGVWVVAVGVGATGTVFSTVLSLTVTVGVLWFFDEELSATAAPAPSSATTIAPVRIAPVG